jgi:hypothetical protein
MSRVDKIALVSKMTAENKQERVEFLKLACAQQGLEIMGATVKVVHTPEDAKVLMEGVQASAWV